MRKRPVFYTFPCKKRADQQQKSSRALVKKLLSLCPEAAVLWLPSCCAFAVSIRSLHFIHISQRFSARIIVKISIPPYSSARY